MNNLEIKYCKSENVIIIVVCYLCVNLNDFAIDLNIYIFSNNDELNLVSKYKHPFSNLKLQKLMIIFEQLFRKK